MPHVFMLNGPKRSLSLLIAFVVIVVEFIHQHIHNSLAIFNYEHNSSKAQKTTIIGAPKATAAAAHVKEPIHTYIHV